MDIAVIIGVLLVCVVAGFASGVVFAKLVIHEARDLEDRANEAFKAVSDDMGTVVDRVEAIEEDAKKRIVRFITNGGNG